MKELLKSLYKSVVRTRCDSSATIIESVPLDDDKADDDAATEDPLPSSDVAEDNENGPLIPCGSTKDIIPGRREESSANLDVENVEAEVVVDADAVAVVLLILIHLSMCFNVLEKGASAVEASLEVL